MRHTAPLAILLVAAALLLLAAPAAAISVPDNAVLQDHFSELRSYNSSLEPSVYSNFAINTPTTIRLYFYTIERYQHLQRVIVTPSPSSIATYYQELLDTQTGYYPAYIGDRYIGSIYVQGSGSALGIYPESWDVSGLSGAQIVTIYTNQTYTGHGKGSINGSPRSSLGYDLDTPSSVAHSADDVILGMSPTTHKYWDADEEYEFTKTTSEFVVLSGLNFAPLGYSDWESNVYRYNSTAGTRFIVLRYGSSELVSIRQTVSSLYDSLLYSKTSTEDIDYLASTPAKIEISAPSGSIYISIYPEDAETPEPSGFSLTLSPPTPAVGSPVTASLSADADAPRYSEIAWTVTDPDGGTDIELYTKSSPSYENWTHYNKTSHYFEASDESAAHHLNFSPTSAGTWTVSAVVRDQQPPSTGAALAQPSASASVRRKAGDVDVIVSIFDGAKSSTSYLSGVGVTALDLSRNSTVLYDSTGTYIVGASGTTSGIATFTAPLGDQILIHVEKTDYASQDIIRYVQPTALPLNQMPISIILMPNATPAADWVYAAFTVTTRTGAAIEGAAVVAGNRTGLTGSLGTCRVAIPADTYVSYSVSKSGYFSQSGYIMPVTENLAISVQLLLTSEAVTTSPIDGNVTTPDYRTIDEKATSALDIIFDNIELFASLGVMVLLTNMVWWIIPGGGRRK